MNNMENNSNYSYKPYFFNFSKNNIINDTEVTYSMIPFSYKLRFTNEIVKASINIDEKHLKAYGEFTQIWKEYTHVVYNNLEKETRLYWHNQNINKSTWDSPIFILLALIDNKVNTEWVPIKWKSIDDNFVKIKFNNHKVLFIDKRNVIITDRNPNSIKAINNFPAELEESTEDMLREVRQEKIKKSLISEVINGVTENVAKKIESPKKDSYLNYKNEIENFKKMLKEKNIGLLSTFSKETPKLIYDNRYNQLPIELRQGVFDEYIRESLLNTKKQESSNINLNVKDKRKILENYKLLLKTCIEKGEITLSTTFGEFGEKYEEDAIFNDVGAKEREFLFNESKLKLKKILEESKNNFINF